MMIHDISMKIHAEMIVYKNKEEKKPRIEANRDFTTGRIYETSITIDSHTGTHLDAPLHVIEGGYSIDKINLDRVITKCRVLDLTNVKGSIKSLDLVQKDIKEGEFILLKTDNSLDDSFNPDFIFLSLDGAKYLQRKKVIGVGIDALGIERNQPNYDTHRTLLKAGIIILEGLRLASIQEGEYTLIALPLNILGVEASPVRAVLVESIR